MEELLNRFVLTLAKFQKYIIYARFLKIIFECERHARSY